MSRVHLHHGKTQVWNSDIEPSGVEAMTRATQAVKPDAVVWRGNPMLPVTQQGLKVLVPIGHEAFVQRFLDNKSTEQQVLFQRIPWVNDPQSVYLLLLMCGSTRANFWLRALKTRSLSPGATMRSCGHAFVRFSAVGAHTLATLALSAGGLGLGSAVRVRHAAHWASWADSLRTSASPSCCRTHD